MIAPQHKAGFSLVAILADGQPADPDLFLAEDLVPIIVGTKALYARTGHVPPWISYLSAVGGEVVGGGAFVGAPERGEVEIAYFTLPGHEGRGHASRTAAALVAQARAAAPEIGLWAKTLPEANASTRILARLGFHRDGTVQDDEIGTAWRWYLSPGVTSHD